MYRSETKTQCIVIKHKICTKSTAGLGSTNNKLGYQIEWLELCEKLSDPALANIWGRAVMDNGRDIILIPFGVSDIHTYVENKSVSFLCLFVLF